MGKNDICMKRWLSDKERFSSLVNGSLFGNKEVVLAETLQREEKEQDVIIRRSDGKDEYTVLNLHSFQKKVTGVSGKSYS